MLRTVLASLLITGALLVGAGTAQAASCAPIKDPYAGSRYDGVDLSAIRATGTTCAVARRTARGAHRKALGLTPTDNGLRRFTWNGWRVTGDLRPESDKYVARKGSRVVRWRF